MTLNARLIAGARISPGTVVHLTFAQADSRRHLLKPLREAHKDRADKRRLAFTAEQTLFFKAGEELGIDGEIDRQLQAAIGASEEQLVDAGAANPGVKKAVAARRTGSVRKAEKVLKDAQADAAEAQVKLDEAAPDDKAAAQAALDKARAAVTAAEEALAQAKA